MATERGHNLMPGPTLLELLIDPRPLGMRRARQVLPAADRTAATTRFGLDDQKEHVPAADARPLQSAMPSSVSRGRALSPSPREAVWM